MNVCERFVHANGETSLMFECPGCGELHVANLTGDRPRWNWNGSLERPTLSPSVLVTWDFGEQRERLRCHSFVTDGAIQFLGDCTHKLAGQTVLLAEYKP